MNGPQKLTHAHTVWLDDQDDGFAHRDAMDHCLDMSSYLRMLIQDRRKQKAGNDLSDLDVAAIRTAANIISAVLSKRDVEHTEHTPQVAQSSVQGHGAGVCSVGSMSDAQ